MAASIPCSQSKHIDDLLCGGVTPAFGDIFGLDARVVNLVTERFNDVLGKRFNGGRPIARGAFQAQNNIG